MSAGSVSIRTLNTAPTQAMNYSPAAKNENRFASVLIGTVFLTLPLCGVSARLSTSMNAAPNFLAPAPRCDFRIQFAFLASPANLRISVGLPKLTAPNRRGWCRRPYTASQGQRETMALVAPLRSPGMHQPTAPMNTPFITARVHEVLPRAAPWGRFRR